MSRDWQKDMDGCVGLPPTPWQWAETDTHEWIEDAHQKLVFGGEMSFWDWIGGDVELEKLFRFFINAPEALSYWLQQYAAEKERADTLSEAIAKAMGRFRQGDLIEGSVILREALLYTLPERGEEA
ncbi:hypothetical protein D3C72_1563690 [compost metagenome]